jgi:glycosyltransferase involved in cell wall biosynthesis
MDTTFRQYLTGGGDPPVQLGNSRRSRSRADSYQVPTRYPLASAGAFTAFVNSVLSEAAQRVDLFSASGPSARAWAARIGLDDSRLRDGRSSVEGLSAAALPGLPSPRLTFAGRLRGDKAPDVLIEALALTDAPPPAYLADDGPLRGALTRLIRARELEAVG